MRQIVQISTVCDPNNPNHNPNPNVKIFALCDDGTLWWSHVFTGGHGGWVECKHIPQPSSYGCSAALLI
jgi:hypothetical protein